MRGVELPQGRGRVAMRAVLTPFASVEEIYVAAGGRDEFLKRTLVNARMAVQEGSMLRFDVLQSTEDLSKFVIVGVYSSKQGIVNHKFSDHNKEWNASVASLVTAAETSQWQSVYPEDGSGYAYKVLLLERAFGQSFFILHLDIVVQEGTQDDFNKKTARYAKQVLEKEPNCMRMDAIQGLDKPTNFRLMYVYANPGAARNWNKKDHFFNWLAGVEDKIQGQIQLQWYKNQYPNLPAAWKARG